MARFEVIVIGAGAAGLAATRALAEAGKRVIVLEARNRIGGRIQTVRDRRFPAPVEAGAEFIHGRPDDTFRVVEEAGLTVCVLPSEHWRRRRDRLVKLTDLSKALAGAMRGIERLSQDVSFAAYLRRRAPGGRFSEPQRLALDFVSGFDAADPERISALSVADEQEGIGQVDEEMQFRLVGGYSGLTDYLREKSVAAGAKILTNSPVSAIEWKRGSVRVTVARAGDRVKTVAGQATIITVPVGVLQLPPESSGAIRFTPEAPEVREAAGRIGSGPVIKAVIKFQRAFWEEPEFARQAGAEPAVRDAAFFQVGSTNFRTWWTQRPLRVPMLTGWSAGPHAAELSGRSRPQLLHAATESLAALFRRQRRTIETEIEQARIFDWLADPWALGAYTYECVGGRQARRKLAEPIGDTLIFAGDACDTTGQASTVAGALASGRKAAEYVLSR